MEKYGFPLEMLMENAGLSIAHAIYDLGKFKRPLIFCGPGSTYCVILDNGGDGYVAARHLKVEFSFNHSYTE